MVGTYSRLDHYKVALSQDHQTAANLSRRNSGDELVRSFIKKTSSLMTVNVGNHSNYSLCKPNFTWNRSGVFGPMGYDC